MKENLINKMLIEKSNQGRKDGVYSRLLGDSNLGALISRIHATSINAGAFLENCIVSIAPTIRENQIETIFNKTLNKGVFLINKKLLNNA